MSESLSAQLTLDSVTVRYGRSVALSGASFQVPSGSITAVLGPSGCGKTTMLRAVAGLEPITEGTVRVGDRVVSGPGVAVPPERRGVGLVPQDGALFPHLTVRGNIGYGLRGRAARRERVEEMLALVELDDVADRRPAQLSGGQRQRVALARALAPAPLLIGLDEPFSALDSGLRTALRSQVSALVRASGATALLVTHDPAEALAMADWVVVLLDGEIRQIGTPEDVYARPADHRVGGLFGELNKIGTGAGRHFARPHELRLHASGALDPATDAVATGLVTAVEFRGAHYQVTVVPTGSGEPVVVVVPTGSHPPQLGDEVAVVPVDAQSRTSTRTM